MDKVYEPKQIKKSYLNLFSERDIQENIRREVLRNCDSTKAKEFCDEIVNYLDLRFISKTKKRHKEVAKLLKMSHAWETIHDFFMSKLKEKEKEYKWII